MGAEPWYYFVPYEPDVSKALFELRQREFKAGRYNPASPFFPFTSDPDGTPQGAQHGSIEEAIEAAGADGTRSILAMHRVAADPDDVDYGVISPLPEEYLEEQFGTLQPTREMIEEDPPITEDMERGQGIYTVAYRDGKPAEIFFGGYSYD